MRVRPSFSAALADVLPMHAMLGLPSASLPASCIQALHQAKK